MTWAATWPPPTNTVLARPLPRSLDPLRGEGLDGFLLRLSYRLERSPYRIACLTGMMKPSGKRAVRTCIRLDAGSPWQVT